MSIETKVFTIVILVAATVSQSHAAEVKQGRRPISKAEFLRLFQEGEEIENRIIPEEAILEAIAWAQEQDSAAPDAPVPALFISNSEIESISINSSQLRKTPITDLAPELQSHYAGVHFKDVVVIPLEITIDNSTFQGFSSFGRAVFKKGISMDGSTFEGSVSFFYAVFQESASFSGTGFKAAFFESSLFNSGVLFLGATFGGANFAYANFAGNENLGIVNFSGATFGGACNFTQAKFSGAANFTECVFQGDVFFIDTTALPQGGERSVRGLEFTAASFSGRVYFTNAKLKKLSFYLNENDRIEATANIRKTNSSRQSVSPVSFNKRVSFTGLECETADFTEVEFRDYVDFNNALFTNYVNFSHATFENSVNFWGTKFPDANTPVGLEQKSGVSFDGVQFLKPFNLDWEQIAGKTKFDDIETWRRLEDTFERSGNLDGQNEAMFQRQLLTGLHSSGWERVANRFEYFFWGYGIRPVRLVGWLLVIFSLFTFLYYTQTKVLAGGRRRWAGILNRLKFALLFSWRTSWKLGYGYENARTPLFKTFALIHSIGFKIMLLCLFKVLSNISPLLNELVGKLIHI